MALIECTDCGAEVSDKAASCIRCGYPLTPATQHEQSPQPEHATTTQQTGKTFKGAQALGALLVCVGVVSCAASDGSGAGMGISGLLFLSGAGLMIGGSVGGWWHHG